MSIIPKFSQNLDSSESDEDGLIGIGILSILASGTILKSPPRIISIS